METELHEWERLDKMNRYAVPGGWLYREIRYEYNSQTNDTDRIESPLVFVPDPTAPHCRPKARRFKLQEGCRESNVDDGQTVFGKPVSTGPYGRQNYGAPCVWRIHGVWEVSHADGSMSYPATQAEAHDALGPDSPWVEVTE